VRVRAAWLDVSVSERAVAGGADGWVLTVSVLVTAGHRLRASRQQAHSLQLFSSETSAAIEAVNVLSGQ